MPHTNAHERRTWKIPSTYVLLASRAAMHVSFTGRRSTTIFAAAIMSPRK